MVLGRFTDNHLCNQSCLMTNSSPCFQEPPSHSSVKIVLKGYVPPSENSLRGKHWSVRNKEKAKVASALRYNSEFTQSDRLTGITTTLNISKTGLSKLDSYLMTHGTSSKEKSYRKRRKATNENVRTEITIIYP